MCWHADCYLLHPLHGAARCSAYSHASCTSSHLILLSLTALPTLQAAHQPLVQPLALADLQCSKRKVSAWHDSLQAPNKIALAPPL